MEVFPLIGDQRWLYGNLTLSKNSDTKLVNSSQANRDGRNFVRPSIEKGREMVVSGQPIVKNEKTSILWLAESTRSGLSGSCGSMRTEMKVKNALRAEWATMLRSTKFLIG